MKAMAMKVMAWPAAWLCASALPAADLELIQLRGHEVQAWAYAQLQPQTAEPIPLWLAPLANASPVSTDERDELDRHDSEQAGVPLARLDQMLATQLAGSERYVLVAEPFPPADSARLQVRLTRYQPAHRRGDESNVWQAIASQWHAWQAGDPQPVAISLQASWHDPVSGRQRQLLLRVDSDTCLRVPERPALAIADDDPAHAEYRLSAIGQAAQAAINRLLAWLSDAEHSRLHAVAIQSVRGNRLQLRDARGLLHAGQELPLYHRDRPDRLLGQVKLSGRRGELIDAYPLTLAAGSIRPGDQLLFSLPADTPVITPASITAGDQCQRDQTPAETASAGHTETQTLSTALALPVR